MKQQPGEAHQPYFEQRAQQSKAPGQDVAAVGYNVDPVVFNNDEDNGDGCCGCC